jgi:hypothetical protein
MRHGEANDDKLKRNNKKNKKERKMKKKDFIKRNILVSWLGFDCFIRKELREGK